MAVFEQKVSNRKLLLAAGWLGLLTFAVALALMFILPQASGGLPRGFRTPILAFEFALTPSDVYAVLGPSDSAGDWPRAHAMDRGNVVDLAFLVLYAAFLGVIAAVAARDDGPRYWVSTGLAVVGAGADVVENQQLFSISAAVRSQADFTTPLATLQWVTWVKWLSLLAAVAWLGPWLWRSSTVGRCTATFAWVGCTGALLAGRLPGVSHEVMAAALSFAYIGLFTEAVRRLRGAS